MCRLRQPQERLERRPRPREREERPREPELEHCCAHLSEKFFTSTHRGIAAPARAGLPQSGKCENINREAGVALRGVREGRILPLVEQPKAA